MTTLTTNDLPTRALAFHDESTVISGAALALNLDTAQQHNFTRSQSAAANGDTFTQSFFLRAGTYSFMVMGITDNNSGKVDWYLDGSLIIAGQDWYTVGTNKNVVKTTTVVVPFDGRHVLKGSVNGQNAGSGGFKLMLTSFEWRQAAD